MVTKSQIAFSLGYNFYERGFYQDAAKQFQDAYNYEPSAVASVMLGNALVRLGMHEDAIEKFEEAMRINPEFGNAYNDMGACLLELRRIDEAECYIKTSMTCSEYKEVHFAYYNLGIVSLLRHDWMKAKDFFKESLDICPTYMPSHDMYQKTIALLQ